MRVRVYQLAQELGISSATLLKQLVDRGVFVRTASAPLDPQVVRQLRGEHLGAPPAGTLHRPARPTGARRPQRPRPLLASSTPAPPNPLLEEAARMFGVPRSSLRPVRSARTTRSAMQHPAMPRGPLAPIATWRTDWLLRFFDPGEIDAWIDAGLSHHDHSRAASLRTQGVTPDLLGVPLDGRTAGQRLRGGESVDQIVARLRQHGILNA